MDFGICGLIDLILLFLSLIAIFLGVRKGFMNKMLSMFGMLLVTGIAFYFSGPLANLLKENDIIYPSWYKHFNKNLMEAYSTLLASGKSFNAADVAEEGLGVWGFVASILVGVFGVKTAAECPVLLADGITMKLLEITSFVILIFVLLAILLTLKILSNGLRKATIIRMADNIFGAILYLAILFVIVSLVFFTINIIVKEYPDTEFAKWISTDLQLGNNNFRFSKYLYDGNFLQKIVDMFD